MKFLLISSHSNGREVSEDEKEAHMKAFGEWLEFISPTASLPVHGGATVTSDSVRDYSGDVAGALMFEAESLEDAIEKTKKSPGLKYGWTHDILKEMPL